MFQAYIDAMNATGTPTNTYVCTVLLAWFIGAGVTYVVAYAIYGKEDYYFSLGSCLGWPFIFGTR